MFKFKQHDEDANKNFDDFDDLDSNAPPEFICPITLSIMKDPVLMPDGQTYEREAIEKALSINPISPVTRMPMKMKHAIPNYALKNLIEKYVQENQQKSKKETIRQIFQKNKNPKNNQKSNQSQNYPKLKINQPKQIPHELSPIVPPTSVLKNSLKNKKMGFKKKAEPNGHLADLISMGFDERSSRAALIESGNDVQAAINILLEKSDINHSKSFQRKSNTINFSDDQEFIEISLEDIKNYDDQYLNESENNDIIENFKTKFTKLKQYVIFNDEVIENLKLLFIVVALFVVFLCVNDISYFVSFIDFIYNNLCVMIVTFCSMVKYLTCSYWQIIFGIFLFFCFFVLFSIKFNKK